MSSRRTLVLSAGMEIHGTVTWEGAITLLYLDKIEVVSEYDETVSSPSTTYKVPAVVRLKSTRHGHYKRGVRFRRINVYIRDGFRCCYCNKVFETRKLTYDHVVPRSRWRGPVEKMTDWLNVVSACTKCNLEKGDRTPAEAGMTMHFQPYKPKTLRIHHPRALPVPMPEEWTPFVSEMAAAS